MKTMDETPTARLAAIRRHGGALQRRVDAAYRKYMELVVERDEWLLAQDQRHGGPFSRAELATVTEMTPMAIGRRIDKALARRGEPRQVTPRGASDDSF